MRRLSGADVAFVFEERPHRPTHTLKVLVFDRRADGSSLTLAEVRTAFERRMHRMDPLRWVLRTVPGRFYLPVFVDSGPVDLHVHVLSERAPAPGDERALGAVASRIASEPLPRDRPLWDATLVEGLAGGQVALVWKIHHSIADGMASLQLIDELCDRVEGGEPERDAPMPSTGEAEPDARALAEDAARDLARLVGRLPGLTARLGRAALAGSRRKRAGGPQPAAAFSAPATVFNHELVGEREFVFVEVPMADIRRIKDRLGGTVNDAFLAVCSSLVRGYLADRDELPDAAMSAVVPVSIRHEGGPSAWGNFPSNYYVNLATDVADPLERYRAIGASQSSAKAWHDTREHWLQFDWMHVWPAWTLYTRMLPWTVSKLAKRATFGLIASNVRGPQEMRWLAGAPMTALHSMGPLARDIALNITAWSYRDQLSFGIHVCRGQLPDPWELAERIPKAVAELSALAG